MVGLAQFIVMFAGPIGVALLAAFVIARWVTGARRRRRREAPQLEVVPGAEAKDARAPAQDPPSAERPALRVVAQGRAEQRRESR